MRLTRNWKGLLLGLGSLAAAAVVAAVPTLLDLIDYELRLGPWVAYGVAALLALLGVVIVIDGLRRDSITVTESGLELRVPAVRGTISWDDIESVVIERDRSVAKEPPTVLVLVPTMGADLPATPKYDSHLKGRKGFILMRIDEVTQGHDGVVAAMTAHAGPRFSDLLRATAA